MWNLGLLGASLGFSSDFELIATTILSSSQPSVTFSNLGDYSSTYKHLQVRAVARSDQSSNDTRAVLTYNGDTTTTNYRSHILYGYLGVVGSEDTVNYERQHSGYLTGGSNIANATGALIIDILDPFSTTKNKTMRTLSGYAATNSIINLGSHLWMNTAAVNSINIKCSSTFNFVSGSRFSLYGIKG
jgi:hypothetical protein